MIPPLEYPNQKKVFHLFVVDASEEVQEFLKNGMAIEVRLQAKPVQTDWQPPESIRPCPEKADLAMFGQRPTSPLADGVINAPITRQQ